jgi:16S rRNA (guanine1207-N2)-methyltransferase
MPNTAGASRFEKELAQATGNITSIQKHKCRAFHAVDAGTWNDETLNAWRSLGGFREVAGTAYLTQAGMFSCEHIDPGSLLLAQHLPANLSGHITDLGAGWGYLSDVALDRCPGIETIDLFEADYRALACAKRNLARHERDISFHWHDVTIGLPETYDAILMNPPFHTGQDTDVDLGRAFLSVAAASLKRHGKLHLVANRQLPYEALLDSLRLHWRKVAEDKTYKVIVAEKR